ncbi:MAG: hypothetical protein AB1632_10485 [Nitrospirota bacterium]
MLKEEISKYADKETGGLCPFIQAPSRDCYIEGWESRYTFSVIYYCLSSFEECEIYQTRIKRKNQGK